MQQDKAALEYQGRQQLRRAWDLVQGACERAFVSVRPDQQDDPLRGAYPTIVDRQPGLGPIAGISAAQAEHPGAAWLVLACDLPFLDAGVLAHLIAARDPSRLATAYRSAHDGLPEPLCAIWEPASAAPVREWISGGRQCPRKYLINADAKLLDQPDPGALDNVNTPEEHAAAVAALASRGPGGTEGPDARKRGSKEPEKPEMLARPQSPDSLKTLKVQYFALFREQAGRSEETIETAADTPAMLYAELKGRHPFRLAPEQLRVAVNTEFSDWQSPLRHGDTVVFIPPVAGG